MSSLCLGFVPSKSRDVVKEQQERCERAQTEPPGVQGATIFPGDHIFDDNPAYNAQNAEGIMPGDIARALREGDGKTFEFYVIGCADYAFNAGSGDRHQTGFIYRVMHMEDGQDSADLRLHLHTEHNHNCAEGQIAPLSASLERAHKLNPLRL